MGARGLICRTVSARQTQSLGHRLGRICRPGDIVCLFGELGAGKTVLAKGIASGLGIDPGAVNSPSFVLMHGYQGGRSPMYHFDFYRLDAQAQISDIGYEEFMYTDGVAVIEWPERLKRLMPREYLEIDLDMVTETTRMVRLRAHGKRYEDLMNRYRSTL